MQFSDNLDDCYHEDNIRFLLGIGLLKASDDDFEPLLAWGKVLRDPILSARVDLKRKAIPSFSPEVLAEGTFSDRFFAELSEQLHAQEGLFTQVLRELTPADRIALRERLTNVSPIAAKS